MPTVKLIIYDNSLQTTQFVPHDILLISVDCPSLPSHHCGTGIFKAKSLVSILYVKNLAVNLNFSFV